LNKRWVVYRVAIVAKWIRRRLWLFLLLALLAAGLTGERVALDRLEARVESVVADVRFSFLAWEADALWSKYLHWLVQPQRYVDETERSSLVRHYVELLSQIKGLERQIETAYADPQVNAPEAETAEVLEELEELRAEAAARQLTAEAILEEQVATVLADEGLEYGGGPLPPVGFHLAPTPYLLIVSPRERIETLHQEELEHGLDTAQRESIEAAVDSPDFSSLVVAIGGISAWPAIVQAWPDLTWLVQVTPHEWTHHYLSFYPLGWEYGHSHETRTINETVATIVGQEVGHQVLARYYPDLLPPPPDEPADQVLPDEDQTPESPEFDFRAEMHLTRVEVDRLLEAGQIEEAEVYMELRRQFFWEHGYQIRKLNQAYFAFHGAYAAEPGATGEDPIGPAVRRLREQSSSLQGFIRRVAGITTLDELLAALDTGAD
jgi:hypothetical protein